MNIQRNMPPCVMKQETCHNFALVHAYPGRNEQFFPSQSCSGIWARDLARALKSSANQVSPAAINTQQLCHIDIRV